MLHKSTNQIKTEIVEMECEELYMYISKWSEKWDIWTRLNPYYFIKCYNYVTD